MAGVTDLPFRVLCREQGAGCVVTEMVSAKAVLYNNKNTRELLQIDPAERPAAVQLFGSEPDIMAEIAARLEEGPYDYIDVNMGCPVPKIVNNGEGSALMKNPERAKEVLTAMVKAVKKPVTVKFRKGFNDLSVNAVEFAKMAESCGGVMRWLEKEFGDWEREEGKRRGVSSLDLMNEEAKVIPAGSDGVVFLPYMSGERSPIWDPDAKGVYYGLDFSKKKGHLIRAAMEGTAYALKHNLEAAEEAGAKVEVLKAMGGAANSHLWTQIKSDVTGKTMEVPSSDTATTLGAALLAGVGVGMYESFEEAVEKTVNKGRVHTPNVEHKEIYEKNYEIYRALYEQLKSLMKKTGGKKQ